MQNQKGNNSSSEDAEAGFTNRCPLYNKPVVLNSVDVYLDTPIYELSYYRDLLHYMRSMEQGDELRIWIDTDGGSTDSALAIAQAMDKSEGDILCIISGKAYSAGGLIALSAPNLIVQENASFMVHTVSYGTGAAKAGNLNSMVDFYTKEVNKIIYKYYKGFLTDQEIEDVINGKDFWFDSEEIIRRLEVRSSLLEAAQTPAPVPKVRNSRKKSD